MSFLSNQKDNIFLISGEVNKQQLYPLASYIGENGRPADVMFNSFLFDMSSGVTLDEWEADIDRVFSVDGGIHALNNASADIKRMLNSSFKYGVYFCAPIPKASLKPFGDINRDGISEKLLDTEDCLRAFELFISIVARRLKISSLAELEIKGFLWYGDTSDAPLVTGCNEIINRYGFNSVAIGYNTEKLKALGFNSAYGQNSVVAVTESTDFSNLCFNNEINLVFSSSRELILNSAVAVNIEERAVYNNLYKALSGENGVLAVKTPEPTLTPVSGVASVPDDCDTVDELTCDITEVTDFIESEEITEATEPELTTQPERIEEQTEAQKGSEQNPFVFDAVGKEAEAVLDGTANDNIFVTPEEKPAKKRKQKKTCPLIKQEKRKALIGAGIAAAIAGVAYLINKFSDD